MAGIQPLTRTIDKTQKTEAKAKAVYDAAHKYKGFLLYAIRSVDVAPTVGDVSCDDIVKLALWNHPGRTGGEVGIGSMSSPAKPFTIPRMMVFATRYPSAVVRDKASEYDETIDEWLGHGGGGYARTLRKNFRDRADELAWLDEGRGLVAVHRANYSTSYLEPSAEEKTEEDAKAAPPKVFGDGAVAVEEWTTFTRPSLHHHPLTMATTESGWSCDVPGCRNEGLLLFESMMYRCAICEAASPRKQFDVCVACFSKSAPSVVSPSPAPPRAAVAAPVVTRTESRKR